MREYGSGGTDAAAAALVTRQRRVNRLLYLALGVTLYLALQFWGDLAFWLAVIAVGLLLAPVLSIESRTVYRTEAPEFAVVDELSSLRNPFTAIWFEWADRVEPAADGRRTVLVFDSILRTTRLTLSVEQRDPRTYGFEIARDGRSLVKSTVTVDGGEAGASVTARTTRNPVKPLSLCTLLLASGRSERLFRSAGYEPVEESTSVRPTLPFA